MPAWKSDSGRDLLPIALGLSQELLTIRVVTHGARPC